MFPFLRRLVALASALAALLAAYVVFVRPWSMRWGATDAEVIAGLPGDQIVRVPREDTEVTRAITIHAPATKVWPWLAQLGQDRGGFYSYELLEDLAGCEMRNADRIYPEFQHWRVGDKLWMYPPEKAGGLGHALLVDFEPGRALGFAARQVGTPGSAPYDGSWSLVLRPVDASTTRLLARSRATGTRTLTARSFDRLVFEPMHFVMERKMLQGIKLRAEDGRGSGLLDVAQVLLWTITFGLFVASAVSVLRGRRWIPATMAFLAAGALFQLLTLLQPTPWIGALLLLYLAILVWLLSKPSADVRLLMRDVTLRPNPARARMVDPRFDHRGRRRGGLGKRPALRPSHRP